MEHYIASEARGTPDSDWGLMLVFTFHSRKCFWHHVMLGFKTRLVISKAHTLTPVLSLQHDSIFKKWVEGPER